MMGKEMTFGRQKRLLVGWMALLAPIPLPFNDVVSWPVVGAYLIGVAFFLRRASLDPPRWLPSWAMNVLGLIYLPIFFLDFGVLSRGRGVVQPVVHLILFALLVKLFAMVRERDKWQSAVGIFFLFLASMGTSVHPSIVLYLITFLVLTLTLLTRFAFLHVLAGFGREDPALARLPLRSFLTFSTAFTILIAIPLFALLPRVRAPFIVGRGANAGSQLESAGFSDQVTLDSIGMIRSSREVAMRLVDETGGIDFFNREMRFKAASYDVYEGGSWRRAPMRSILLPGTKMRFDLTQGQPSEGKFKPTRWVQIWLRPIHSSSLPLPVETVLVQPRSPNLVVDHGGAVSLRRTPLETLDYRAALADRAVLTGSVPSGTPDDPTLDLTGVTPRVAELAGQVMGQGTARARASRLETHLMQKYNYTLDFVGRSADNPIEDFLFKYRSGQCEYFASSMVLMLRSQGIPARLVTGFLGGELNPFEGYYIVRDSNAHAWVEAYLPGEGWTTFDPTPPAGRPVAEEEGAWLLARQAWDFVLFRWDRYILTFSLYDQLRIFGSLRDVWQSFWKTFQGKDATPSVPLPSPALSAGPETAEPEAKRGLPDVPLPAAIGATLFAALAYILFLKLRPPLTATVAYRRLRNRLQRAGIPVSESLPPLELQGLAAELYPAAAAPAARVIHFYLRESFGGEELEDEDRETLKTSLEEAEKGVKRRSEPAKKAS